ncbi:MAG: CinA family protein [Gammaproteobacteria bacterium]|nr:CinA family protein [Gammaproteobacteria bacterium]
MNSPQLLMVLDQVASLLKAQGATLAVAESCTAGWIAKTVTDRAGSSAWFEAGFVTYSNAAKESMLSVPASVLQRFGAVSEACAEAMAAGVLLHSKADFSLAVTGIAGPGGGSVEKPVGLVCFAWTGRDLQSVTESVRFFGNRDMVRQQTVQYALSRLLVLLKEVAGS